MGLVGEEVLPWTATSIGPVIGGFVSQTIGWRWTSWITLIPSLLATIGCALAPSIETLVFFRFMSGLGGSACQTIGGAIIADVFPVSERGRPLFVGMWLGGRELGRDI
ncbi:unnamed protein product [Clonostachys rosea]|uniref:Major facilitator superfamily (MFS) profile domain-containing protein n=1 Tax=Bionectria ochroleuca TaxID=29856 RepID=A0ABY6TP87_BIOOC|nr:unnamed protein product [Clonostachys rosea]